MPDTASVSIGVQNLTLGAQTGHGLAGFPHSPVSRICNPCAVVLTLQHSRDFIEHDYTSV
jgi:hypothetical protein